MFELSVLQVIVIDVLLSGDNAVVIALVCAGLPARQRVLGITFGVILAIVLRILMASWTTLLLSIPFFLTIGALTLMWIAIKLMTADDDGAVGKVGTSLWNAVWLVAFADAMMSIDNVVAIAGASHGNYVVFMIGLLVSMPLMIVGASLISTFIARFPILVWAGGALLGWVAGGMVADDLYIARVFPHAYYVFSLAGGVVVVIVSLIMELYRVRHSRRELQHGASHTSSVSAAPLRAQR